MSTPRASVEVRQSLVEALEADLVGPFDRNPSSTELLQLPPSRWYLTGFLAPQEGRDPVDPTDDDELGAGDDEDDATELAGAEPEPKRPNRLPASIGLSVLVPRATTVTARVSWADYLVEEVEGEKSRSPILRQRWRRVPHATVEVPLPLDTKALQAGVPVPDSRGLELRGQVEDASGHGVPNNTRALAVFLVNRREPGEKGRLDEQFVFQVQLEIRSSEGLVDRPNLRDDGSEDWDERVADLQFRSHVEHAVGHGVSIDTVGDGGRVVGARSSWLPRARVRRVVTNDAVSGVTTGMEDLAAIGDGASLIRALSALPEAYGRWIGDPRAPGGGHQSRGGPVTGSRVDQHHAPELRRAGFYRRGEAPGRAYRARRWEVRSTLEISQVREVSKGPTSEKGLRYLTGSPYLFVELMGIEPTASRVRF